MSERIVTLRDLEKVEGHLNLWSRTIYQSNGVVIALQATLDSNKARVEGIIEPHTHEFDELIYKIANDYGIHNRGGKRIRDKDEHDYIRGYGKHILGIPKGVKHGGSAYGIWLSIKPENYVFSKFFCNDENTCIEYLGDDHSRLMVITDVCFDHKRPDTLDFLVITEGYDVLIFDPKKETLPETLRGKEYLALRVTKPELRMTQLGFIP